MYSSAMFIMGTAKKMNV